MIVKSYLLNGTFVAVILMAMLFPGTAFAAPVSFDWGSFSSTGLTTYGVYDTNNTTILQTGDLVQLIWAGPDGAIDLPRCTGTTTDDDQLLDSSIVQNTGSLPPPAQNKGYIPFKTYTFDTGDPQSGGAVYIRAWNNSAAATGTAYGNSQVGTLNGGTTFNALRWFTNGTDCIPQAVSLAGFSATSVSGQVSLQWETTSEINNQGFNLYRGATPSGPRTLLAFIPSQGPGSTQGFVYEWLDADVTEGETYYYWLEDVDLNGVTSMHGPESVTVQSPTAVSLTQLTAEARNPDPIMLFRLLLLVPLVLLALAYLFRKRVQFHDKGY